MHYWNQKPFEGLKSIGEAYANRQGYENFSRYCLLKEKGLRKQSLEALNKFLCLIREKDRSIQRHTVLELCNLMYNNRAVDHLNSYHLTEFLKDTLQVWIGEEANKAELHTWYAFVGGGNDHYENALKLDPDDQIALNAVISGCIDEVDYQTHHLDETRFIGDETAAEGEIRKAGELVLAVKSPERRKVLEKEIEYYSDLLTAWKRFRSDENSSDFAIWTAEHYPGHFRFPVKVYYDE